MCFAARTGWASSKAFPDWVLAAAHQPLPEYSASTGAVVLLDDIIYTVAPDGRATEHERRVVKVLRPSGRRAATPEVEFDKDSKILAYDVWAIDPAGHEIAMRDDEMAEVGLDGGGVAYTDVRFKVARPPGADPGGVVAWEVERIVRAYLPETTWEFQSGVPALQESFTLHLPPGFSYATTWAHHAPEAGADLENGSTRWQMSAIPAVDLVHVPLAPAAGSLEGRMTVHYSGPSLAAPQEGTWKGIGEWYTQLAAPRLEATPEVTAKAAALTAGASGFYDKARALGEFVQGSIRYYAVELGVGGYQPHAATDTLHGRYGDCKDKAALLKAMLASVGIDSAMLMVDTERGVIDPAAPSIVGNHMVLAIALPTGFDSTRLHSVVTAGRGTRYLIFDPTWDETPFGQLEENLQGSYGLLVNGDVHGVLLLTYTGAQAMHWRDVLLRRDEEALDNDLVHSLERELPKTLHLKMKGVQNGPAYEKPLIVSVEVAGKLGQATGKRLILPGDIFVSGEPSEFTEAKRDVPVDAVLQVTAPTAAAATPSGGR